MRIQRALSVLILSICLTVPSLAAKPLPFGPAAGEEVVGAYGVAGAAAVIVRDAAGALSILSAGARRGPYAAVSALGTSADGSRVAYRATEPDGTAVLVAGELELPTVPEDGRIAFLGAARDLLAPQADGPLMKYAVEGRPLGSWASVGPFELSPDGTSFAYPAVDETGARRFGHNDRAYGPFEALRFVGWAPDGRTPRYVAARDTADGRLWFVLEAERRLAGPFGPYPAEPAVAWTDAEARAADPRGACLAAANPSGDRVAFVERDGRFFYIDETRFRYGPFLGVLALRYTADGTRFAAVVEDLKNARWLTGDGFKTAIAGGFRGLGLSADGNRVTLAEGPLDGSPARVAEGDRVLEGAELAWWTADGSLDAGFPAVVAVKAVDGSWTVASGNATAGPFSEVRFFRSRGAVCSYVGTTPEGVFVHSGASAAGPFDEVVELGADAKGQAAYFAKSGGAWSFRIGTSAVAGPFASFDDGAAGGTRQVFDADGAWAGAIVVADGRYLGRYVRGSGGRVEYVGR